MSRADQIAEMKAWSKNIHKVLIKKFPESNTGKNIIMDSEYSEEIYLYSLIEGDIHANHPHAPTRLTRIGTTYRIGYHTARGRHAFIINFDKEVIVGKHGHEHLSKGRPVLFAGEVIFKNGELLFWTNNSGHYKPNSMLITNAPSSILPVYKYSSIHKRELWVIAEALKVTNNVTLISSLTGWSHAQVRQAFTDLHIVRYKKQW